MKNYVIYTDSACDISGEMLQKWGVLHSDLRFYFDGDEREYSNNDMDIFTFYNKMREGGVAKTSAINMQTFLNDFEALLAEGKDVLYIGFSSGLSSTYSAAHFAAEELRAKYPDRKIMTVDSLAGSASEALLLYLTVKKKEEGATIEETAAYAEEMRGRISLWVTVEDLVYLKRGGRVSTTSAFVGGALNIKPIICLNEEGKLISKAKVVGRKHSFRALADKYGEKGVGAENGALFITHADCQKDAEELAQLLRKRYNVEVDLISDIGPVIGAHTGPGAIAFAFVNQK